jgi:hypothetical protein
MEYSCKMVMMGDAVTKISRMRFIRSRRIEYEIRMSAIKRR